MLTVFFSPSYVHGGGGTVVIERPRGLQARGCTADVFVPILHRTAAFDAASTAEGVSRLSCPKWPLLFDFVFARGLRPLLAPGQCDALLNLRPPPVWKLDVHPRVAAFRDVPSARAGAPPGPDLWVESSRGFRR